MFSINSLLLFLIKAIILFKTSSISKLNSSSCAFNEFFINNLKASINESFYKHLRRSWEFPEDILFSKLFLPNRSVNIPIFPESFTSFLRSRVLNYFKLRSFLLQVLSSAFVLKNPLLINSLFPSPFYRQLFLFSINNFHYLQFFRFLFDS